MAVVVVVFGLPVIGQGGRQANTHASETAARQRGRTLRKIVLSNRLRPVIAAQIANWQLISR